MSQLSEYMTDSTVQAVYDHYKRTRYGEPRTYLGASIIGKECRRALWLEFRQAKHVQHDGRLYRLFETGHLAEPRFIQDLRDVGVTVFDIDKSTGEQWGVSFCGGHFRGHADGVAIGIKGAEKTWHLLEFKTHSEKSFNDLKAKGVQISKPMHYDQMQVYMHGLELTRAYYLAVNKNTDELYGERISYDKEHALKVIERAESIIFSAEPPLPISDNPSWYQCKFCEYSDFCHQGSYTLPDVNCRTCIHSTPVDGGWICEHDEPWQMASTDKPCQYHRFIPQILPDYEFQSVQDENVFYRSKKGYQYINDSKGLRLTEEQCIS